MFLFWHKNRWGVTKSIKKAFIYTYSTQLLICMGQHGWWFQSVPWAVAKPSVATNGIWCMFGWLKALQRLKRNCVGVCVHRAWKGVGLCILVLNGSRPYTKQWKGTRFKTPLLLVGHGLGFLHLLSVWNCKRAIDCSVLWLLPEMHNLHWAYVSKTCSLYQRDQD